MIGERHHHNAHTFNAAQLNNRIARCTFVHRNVLLMSAAPLQSTMHVFMIGHM
jgi:hypothetical protein